MAILSRFCPTGLKESIPSFHHQNPNNVEEGRGVARNLEKVQVFLKMAILMGTTTL